MVTNTLSRTAEQLRRAVLLDGAAEFGDGALLDRFLHERDESAFEVLVRRHGPMVQGVCRRILGNAADADDAFQATFIVLLRKAESVRPRDHVGPWLQGVAYRTACKARGLAARRRSKEQPLADRPLDYLPTFDVHDWLPLLDRELGRLPEKYRTVVVLCDLQGMSRHDVASRLRLSAGTLSSRLARGRALLGDRLKRRGVALSVFLLVCSEAASASVPLPLVNKTCESIAAAAAGRAVANNIHLLSYGVMQAMVVRKLLNCTVAALLAVVVGLGIGWRGFVEEARADKPVAAEKPVAADKPAKPVGDKPAKPEGDKPAADKPAKPEANKNAAEKPPVGATVQGRVKSADNQKKSVTLIVAGNKGTKETKEETYPLANDVAIFLEHGLKKKDVKQLETKPGTIADLVADAPVTAQLSLDGKSIAKITIHGGSLFGRVKSVDINKKTITIQTKGKDGAVEKTLTLVEDAIVVLDDGMGDKKNPMPPKEGKLADLNDDMPVYIQLSGYDRTQAVGVRATGPSVGGTVKSVDVGNNTITLQTKGDGGLVETTYTVHKNARISTGKLADVEQGKHASMRLSIEDKKTVVTIDVTDK